MEIDSSIDSLVHVSLHVNALLGPFQLRVKDHVLPGCQSTDEHVILRADPYVGFAVLFAVQTNLTGGRRQHPRQHLAETKVHTRKTGMNPDPARSRPEILQPLWQR